jgi:hypothetical protein
MNDSQGAGEKTGDDVQAAEVRTTRATGPQGPRGEHAEWFGKSVLVPMLPLLVAFIYRMTKLNEAHDPWLVLRELLLGPELPFLSILLSIEAGLGFHSLYGAAAPGRAKSVLWSAMVISGGIALVVLFLLLNLYDYQYRLDRSLTALRTSCLGPSLPPCEIVHEVPRPLDSFKWISAHATLAIAALFGAFVARVRLIPKG